MSACDPDLSNTSQDGLATLGEVGEGVDKALEALTLDKDHASQIGADSDTTLSAACRVPAEVLGAIFEDCVDDCHIDILGPKIPMPWALAWVCRNWRETALSLPNLWTCFTANLNHIDDNLDKAVPRATRIIDAFLERSRNAPLTVDVATHPDPETSPAFRAFANHSDRWKNIAIRSRGEDNDIRILNEICTHRVHQLQRLNLLNVQGSLDLTAFNDAPQLKSIVLCRCDHERLNGVPWQQITDLMIVLMPGLVSILAKAPNLISVRVGEGVPAEIVSPPPSSLIHFGQLSSLAVMGSQTNAIQYICTPVLFNLMMVSVPASLWPSYAQLLSRSVGWLGNLGLHGVLETSDLANIRLILQAVPGLFSLDFASSYTAIEELYTVLSDANIVPRLRTIGVKYIGPPVALDSSEIARHTLGLTKVLDIRVGQPQQPQPQQPSDGMDNPANTSLKLGLFHMTHPLDKSLISTLLSFESQYFGALIDP